MIRLAKFHDAADLLFLAEKMHAESRYRDRPFDAAKVARLIDWRIDGNGLALVAELEGEVVGGFLGAITDRSFNDDAVAYDDGLFVSPDRRGGILAIRMLEWFARWAREQGAIPAVGITTGVTPEATARLLKSAGFEPVGTLFEAKA